MKRQQFEQALGYRFAQSTLLDRALRHASLDVVDDNERLEFLGDRVLGLVIAEALFEQHEAADEGDLARRLNQLVSRKSCALVARDWQLAKVLRVDDGISRKTDMPENVLADGCEAVLGAVYLDGGLPAAKALILKHWAGLMDSQTDAPVDSKTALQEWLMQRGLALPHYEIIDRTGPDHAPEFTVEVQALDGVAQGCGASRKLAEQRAAATLLTALQQGETS